MANCMLCIFYHDKKIKRNKKMNKKNESLPSKSSLCSWGDQIIIKQNVVIGVIKCRYIKMLDNYIVRDIPLYMKKSKTLRTKSMQCHTYKYTNIIDVHLPPSLTYVYKAQVENKFQ